MGTRKGVGTTMQRLDRGHVARVLLPVLIIGAGVAAYFNSFDGSFVLDDGRYIENNLRIRQLWPPLDVLSGRRPVLDLSLAINYAIGELHVGSYHAFNLLIHILAALTLYGIVRRTLLLKPYRDRFVLSSRSLALSAALLWTVHPLNTQSVTYLIQRSESLMGLFYLLTLYCVIRAADESRQVRWYVAAVVCCALGMGSKGVMVTAPVMVLLYDRVFISKSSVEIFRRRWGLYLGLAATSSVLWVGGVMQGVLSSSKKVATVGFSFKDITPPEYAMTQFGVLVKYLELSLWPYPLCLDYAWPVARSAETVVVPAIIIAALFIAVVWALIRNRWWGFVGAWFFLILAPTSSIIPIRDPLFEHRMYLPLAAVMVLTVIGAHRFFQSLAGRWLLTDAMRTVIAFALVGAAAVSLGLVTARRNEDYENAVMMWQDVVAKRPRNVRARYNLGTGLLDANELDRAIETLRQALLIDPLSLEAHYNLGKALCRKGEALSRQGRGTETTGRYIEEGTKHYLEALRINPELAKAHSDLGNVLARAGRFEEAIAHYREAIRVQPDYVQAHYNLGSVLLNLSETDEAIEVLRHAVRLSPETARIHFALGNAYAKQRNIEEAVKEYNETLQIQPGHDGARRARDAALTQQHHPDEP